MRKHTQIMQLALATVALMGSAPPAFGGSAEMSCQLASPTAPADSEVEIHTFLQNAVNVRGYQTRISIVRTSGTGTVTVECPTGVNDPNVRIDTGRPDFIFASQSNYFPITNCTARTAATVLLSGGVNVGGTPAYMSTYTLMVSADAAGGSTFEISIDPMPDSALSDSGGAAIPFTIGAPCVLTVQAPETLEFVPTFCSSCVHTGTDVQFQLRVSGLSDPINGVQALFSYDPGVMLLTNVTAGDGEGSPWDAGAVIAFPDDNGEAALAVALNGLSSQADAIVATLSFQTLGAGTPTVDFRPNDPPFATRLTTELNQVINPTVLDSTSILVGAYAKGDVNGDGPRDGLDIQRFVDLLLDDSGALPGELCAADLNGDGEITVEGDLDLEVECLVNEMCVCP